MRTTAIRAFRSSFSRLQHLNDAPAINPALEYIAYPEFIRRNLTEEEEQQVRREQAASSDQDEVEAPPTRRSQAAKDGSSRIGMVVLPVELQMAVTHLIENGDKALLRKRALQLYDYFRSTTAADSAGKGKGRASRSEGAGTNDKIPTKPFLDGSTALAYTAGVMPNVYSATEAVFAEAQNRFELATNEDSPPWIPKKIVDWGAGVGSAAWAAKQVWTESHLAYTSLDSSRAMQTISAALLAQLPQASLSTKLLQTSLGSPDLAAMLDNAHPQVSPRDTMALAAFTLGDLPSDKVRRETVRAMWDSGAEVIVIIDRGTPKGFDLVATARDQLLRLGRHTADRTAAAEKQQALMDEQAPAVDQEEELTIGDTTFFAQEEQASTALASPIDGRGCHIVAPCPHEGVCPLHKTKNFCHFSQKLQRPAFLRKTKHASNNEESASYSYFILKRGERPSPQPVWPRLTAAPLKRGGHVVLDACCPSEQMERFIIAKSDGKQKYYDARKSRWGDSFPHWDSERSETRRRQ